MSVIEICEIRPKDPSVRTIEPLPSFRFIEQEALDSAHRQRRHALILPREHGAWGLLLVPFVTGAGVALHENAHILPGLLLLTAALALFWMRTPLENLLGTSLIHAHSREERRMLLIATLGLAAVAVLSLAALLWAGHNPYLWWIGGAAAVAFLAQAIVRRRGRSTRMLAEVIGTIGLTLSAPAAYYVMTGQFNVTAWMLWMANLIFAGDQIHYVQLRIHTVRIEGLRARLARGWRFALGQGLMTIWLTVACVGSLLPKYASLAFAPVLFRGWFYFIQEPRPLVVRRLGWSELAHAAVFCALFIGAVCLTAPKH